MRTVVVIVGLVAIVCIAGCGGGSVEHEQFESPDFSGQRTKIHVHDEPSGDYRVADGQSVHVHVHAGNGQSVCIEITTGR